MIRRLVVCTLLVSGVVLAGAGIASAAGLPSSGAKPGATAKPDAVPSWSVQTTPKKLKAPSQALSISCATTTSCMAVGGYESIEDIEVPLAESWNGQGWTVDATPSLVVHYEDFASDLEFTSVSCTSPTDCEAVGWSNYSQLDPPQPNYTLAASWNGSSWDVQETPNVGPPTDGENDLTSVSCISSSFCTDVGWTVNPEGGLGDPTTIAELWDGTSWTTEATPAITGNSQLNGVSCTSSTDCVSVGSLSGEPLAETWNGSTWTVQATPNPAGSTSASLASVSCTGTGSCNAVGSYTTGTTTASFAEFWDGSSWTVQDVPEPAGAASGTLSSVSCADTGTCTAVGDYTSGTGDLTLAEGWNGTVWSIEPSPDPSTDQSSSLAGVSCPSGGPCQAVGTGTEDGMDDPISVTSAGTSWTPGLIRDPGFEAQSLAGVSCESATECQAVGTYPGQNLAEGWNGNSWNVEPTALEWIHGYLQVPSALNSVSCTSSSACVGAGETWTYSPETYLQGEFPDVSIWNGSSWVNEQLLYDIVGTMTGVSCTTTTSCTAVGFSPQMRGALIYFWNGSEWKAQSPAVPSGGSMTNLKSVSCLPTGMCTAVGTYTTSAGATALLVEVRKGKSWTVEPAPTPHGASSSTLNGVSCTSVSACTAVGSYNAGAFTSALEENWNGTSWRTQSTPIGGPNSLNTVSCTSASACMAVGSDKGSPSLIDSWNGASWSAQAISLPYGATSEVLNGVSCWTAANGQQCTAVGSYDSDGIKQTLAVTTAGSSPFIRQEPWDEYVNAGRAATFSALGTGYPAPTLQWQVSADDGGTWTALVDGAQPDGSAVSGAETEALRISHVQSDENGYEYEVVFSNSVGSATSDPVSLIIT